MLSVDDFMLWSFSVSVSAFTELTWMWTCPLVLCTCIFTYRWSCIVCYWVTHAHTYAGSTMKTKVWWQTDAWLSLLSVSWPAALLRSLVGSEAGVCVRFCSAFRAEQDLVGFCSWMEVQQPALQISLREEGAVNWKLSFHLQSAVLHWVLQRWRHTGAVSWEELSADGFLCVTVT